ncbi:unnamed protein product [Linum trigynum]|uniref:RNase H type-1 domain-containing protein n=1 Tax=Linum trigynum TaxID=586398 RepID=A0AAV2G0B9_9ROSI
MNAIHQPHLLMAVVAGLWRIWKSRNWVVFEGKQFGILALLRQYYQQYQEWMRIPGERGHHLCRSSVSSDSTTVVQSITCRWDGATKAGSHAAGGIVINDLDGNILLVRGVQLPDTDDPLGAEMLVLREAELWCLELGFHAVCFQGDAKVIIDKINRRDVRDDRIGALLEEIILVFTCHSALSVRFVGRSNNRTAHLVAKKALACMSIF